MHHQYPINDTSGKQKNRQSQGFKNFVYTLMALMGGRVHMWINFFPQVHLKGAQAWDIELQVFTQIRPVWVGD